MSQTERLFRLDTLIRTRGPISFAALREAVEVSPATLKRDLEYLRSRLGAPIEYDRFSNGYRLAADAGSSRGAAGLGGLGFDERELYGLLMAHQMLVSVEGEGGPLARHLQPLLDRLHRMIGASAPGPGRDERSRGLRLVQRVRILTPARRAVAQPLFECVAQALMARKRLQVRYLTRGRGTVSERELSPQRLVHYRNAWYLDAWCHRQNDLRRFALDAIEHAEGLPAAAETVPAAEVARAMDAGYGIYAGSQAREAHLLFDTAAARWASREQWHPQQNGQWRDDGRYELRLPYVDEDELAMDLMRQADEVTVLGPPSLRAAVARRVARAQARHGAEEAAAVGANASPAAPRARSGARRPSNTRALR